MSHPKDRRERFLIGKHKGEVRATGYWRDATSWARGVNQEEFTRRSQYLRRDTTKLCSCSMCGNPRRTCWYKGIGKRTFQERKFFESIKKENIGM